MNKLRFLLVYLVLLIVIMGCSRGTRVVIVPPVVQDTANYTIDRVMIINSPVQPGAGTLEVRIVYTLHQSGGTVAPMIYLLDDDDFLRLGDDMLTKRQFVEGADHLSPGQHDGIIELSLSCNGDEVVGPLGNTGEGHREWWDSINEAEIKAAAQRGVYGTEAVFSSDPVELWCE